MGFPSHPRAWFSIVDYLLNFRLHQFQRQELFNHLLPRFSLRWKKDSRAA
jgi:hypothetical protein